MNVRAVLFDMGGTLLHFYPPGGGWEDMEKSGARGLYALLTGLGYGVPPYDEALEQSWQVMRNAWISLGDKPDPQTLTLESRIRALLTEIWGLEPTEGLVQMAQHAYIAGAQVNVRPFANARAVLAALKTADLPIGLISNTVWPGHAHRYDLDYYGMLQFLDFTLFSSDELAWKPFATIFERAIERLGIVPADAVYIGDSLFFDVYGAQQAGLKTIWIEQPRRWWPPSLGIDDIIPNSIVKDIGEVTALLVPGG
jgi:putative hydrolase of the HAD superfamily